MTNASMKLDIPGVDFEGLAREAIATKLTEALIGNDTAITALVANGLAQKVDSRGVVSARYGSDNKTPFVEWLAQDMVRKVTKEVLAEKMEEFKPALRKSVEAALKRSNTKIARALVDGWAAEASGGYRVKIGFDFEKDSSY